MVYTILLTAGAIALIVMSFIWFTGYTFDETNLWEDPVTGIVYSEPTCGSNQTLIIITIFMIILVCGIRFRRDSSIFTGALVNCWLAYLLWSALASQPYAPCNTKIHSSATTVFQILTHFGWTFITLFMLAIATASEPNEKGGNAVKDLVGEDEKLVDAESVDVELDGKNVKGAEVYVFPITR